MALLTPMALTPMAFQQVTAAPAAGMVAGSTVISGKEKLFEVQLLSYPDQYPALRANRCH